MANGGCGQSFQSGLTEVCQDVVSPGLNVAGGVDRAKLKEFRDRLQEEYVSCGWRNGKGLSTLNPRKEVWSFSTEAKVE